MGEARPTHPHTPPSAGRGFAAFLEALAGRRPALFLDYDGTLTPIVDRPERARIDDATRAAVARLAVLCPLAVVSGRDLDDVAGMVGLEELVYAGSHGFDIRGPGLRTQIGLEYAPALERADAALRQRLAAVPGALVERKRFAIAVHTRLVEPAAKPAVAAAVLAAAAGEADLRVTGGKEIHELRPNLPWDKGRAVLALIDALGLGSAVPVYIGDDETDEDAFRALAGRGIGIRVMDRPDDTAAAWSLGDPAEVRVFLERLAGALEGR
ncbi:trehalose-phosphatase [Azospirillum sp. TSO22-1]|uniref:trehalose-phosphatase n=1 Tax=Azospirillum sp. TSO22-1 TaxID=716789 RepID=UPI000D62186A|nr:trehalose-phosphatase [Azospirillum sp. TSO22-1]PWC43163.1 trehalose phosphatase [Azospirillum sp. TSO22-1]